MQTHFFILLLSFFIFIRERPDTFVARAVQYHFRALHIAATALDVCRRTIDVVHISARGADKMSVIVHVGVKTLCRIFQTQTFDTSATTKFRQIAVHCTQTDGGHLLAHFIVDVRHVGVAMGIFQHLIHRFPLLGISQNLPPIIDALMITFIIYFVKPF